MPDTDPVAIQTEFVSALRESLKAAGKPHDDPDTVARFADFYRQQTGSPALDAGQIERIKRETLIQAGKLERQGALSAAGEAFKLSAWDAPKNALTGDMAGAAQTAQARERIAFEHPYASELGSMGGTMAAPIAGAAAGLAVGGPVGAILGGAVGSGVLNAPGAAGRGMERSIALDKRTDLSDIQKRTNLWGNTALDFGLGFLPGGMIARHAGGETIGKVLIGVGAEGGAIGAGAAAVGQGIDYATGARDDISLSEIGAGAAGGALAAAAGAGVLHPLQAPRVRAAKLAEEKARADVLADQARAQQAAEAQAVLERQAAEAKAAQEFAARAEAARIAAAQDPLPLAPEPDLPHAPVGNQNDPVVIAQRKQAEAAAQARRKAEREAKLAAITLKPREEPLPPLPSAPEVKATEIVPPTPEVKAPEVEPVPAAKAPEVEPVPAAKAPEVAPPPVPEAKAPDATVKPLESAEAEEGSVLERHDAEVRRRLLAAGMTEEEYNSSLAELKKQEKQAAEKHAAIMKEADRIEAALEASGAPGNNTRDTALSIALGEPIKAVLDKWAQAPVHGVHGFDDAVRARLINPDNAAARKALSVIAAEIEYQKAKPAEQGNLKTPRTEEAQLRSASPEAPKPAPEPFKPPETPRTEQLRTTIKGGQVDHVVLEDGTKVQQVEVSPHNPDHFEGMLNKDEAAGTLFASDVTKIVTKDGKEFVHDPASDSFLPSAAAKPVRVVEPKGERAPATGMDLAADTRPRRVAAEGVRPVPGTLVHEASGTAIQHDPTQGYRALAVGPKGWHNKTKTVDLVPIPKDLALAKGKSEAAQGKGVWFKTKEEALKHAADYEGATRRVLSKTTAVPKPTEPEAPAPEAVLAGKAQAAVDKPLDREARVGLIAALHEGGFKIRAEEIADLHRRIDQARARADGTPQGSPERDRLNTHLNQLKEAAKEIRESAITAGQSGDMGVLEARYGRKPGSPSEVVDRAADIVNNGKHATEQDKYHAVVDHLEANGLPKPLADLARVLLDRTHDDAPKLTIKTGEPPVDTKTGLATHGEYNPKTREITIYTGNLRSPAELAHAISHELVHDHTHERLDADPVFRKRVQDLLDTYRDYLAERGLEDPYAAQDVHEFLSESMTKPEVQAQLREILAPAGGTLWDKFVGAVRKTLRAVGIDTGAKGTLLQHAIDAYEVASLANGTTRKFYARASKDESFKLLGKSIAAIAKDKDSRAGVWQELATRFSQTAAVVGEDTTGYLGKVVERARYGEQRTTSLNRQAEVDYKTFDAADTATKGKLGEAMLDMRAASARAGQAQSLAQARAELARRGFTPEQIDAANAAYSMYARVNTERADALDMAAAANAGTPAEQQFRTMATALRKRAQEAYIPLKRNGEYIVHGKDATKGFRTALEATKYRDQLRAGGDPDAYISASPEGGRKAGVATKDTAAFEKTLMDSGLPLHEVNDIMDAVRPVLLDKTLAENELRAAGKPGYEKDLREVLATDIPRRNVAAGRFIAAHDPRFLNLDSNIVDPKNEVRPDHVRWFKKYQEAQNKDYTSTDALMSMVGSATAVAGLSSPITGLTNFMSQIQSAQVASFLSGKRNPFTSTLKGVMDAGLAGVHLPMEVLASAKGLKEGTSSTSTSLDFGVRQAEALRAKGDAKRASELDQSLASGSLWDKDAHVTDLRNSGRTLLNSLPRLAMWMHAHTSRISRTQTWLTGSYLHDTMDAAGWRKAESLGYQGPKQDRQAFADWYVQRVEGGYGANNRPEVFRSGLPAVAYTFQSYAHNQVHLLNKLRQAGGNAEDQRRGWAVLAAHLGTLAIMGGAINALPFARTLTDLADKLRGDGDRIADDWSRKYGKWTTESVAAELLPHGVAHDVLKAIGERAGVGNAASGIPGVEIPLQLGAAAADLAGGARDMAKGGADYYAGRDQFTKGVRTALPQAGRYVKAATGEPLTSVSGKVQVGDPTASERLSLALGATPGRQVEARKAGSVDTQYHAGRLRSLAAELADAVADKDDHRRELLTKDFQALREKAIQEFQAEKNPARRAVLRGRIMELDPSAFGARVRNAVRARLNPEAAAIQAAPKGYREAVADSFTGDQETPED